MNLDWSEPYRLTERLDANPPDTGVYRIWYEGKDSTLAYIGESTNNRAEYHTLIRGLELASETGCTEVEARGDSEVIVKQVRGEYGVNEPELRPLRNRVQGLAEEFDSFEIQHVSRDENWEADELVEVDFSD
jgi:ribonuclease HI